MTGVTPEGRLKTPRRCGALEKAVASGEVYELVLNHHERFAAVYDERYAARYGPLAAARRQHPDAVPGLRRLLLRIPAKE